jgi:hypothetical protein
VKAAYVEKSETDEDQTSLVKLTTWFREDDCDTKSSYGHQPLALVHSPVPQSKFDAIASTAAATIKIYPSHHHSFHDHFQHCSSPGAYCCLFQVMPLLLPLPLFRPSFSAIIITETMMLARVYKDGLQRDPKLQIIEKGFSPIEHSSILTSFIVPAYNFKALNSILCQNGCKTRPKRVNQDDSGWRKIDFRKLCDRNDCLEALHHR